MLFLCIIFIEEQCRIVTVGISGLLMHGRMEGLGVKNVTLTVD